MNFCLSAVGIGLPDNEPRSDPTDVHSTLFPDWIDNGKHTKVPATRLYI